ncbi:ABC transporter substrate-binding protein [Haloferax sp. YSMS24]|uniref:ABC transporter substrate-binding protein n=1 Tax=unclassified Haloferax TaxID=2625095 RepID=UPI00398D4330
MTDNSFADDVSRRTYLKLAGGAGSATLLAGCTGGGGGGGGEDTTTEGGSDDTTTTESGGGGGGGQTFEIVHWWTAGGEQEALNALLEGFQEAYPDVEVENNPAPGGAGSALDTVIKNRVLNQNPPSTFQIWPGKALFPYTDADLLTDISDSVWGKNDMQNAYLDGVQEAAKGGTDNFVSVPINIHRLNNLFYNTSVLESAGVDPASIESPSDLTSALETVASETDAVPMAHQTQSPWSTVQLWETILIGEAGVGAFETFTNGDVSSVEDEVKSALQTLVDYSDHFPEDAGSISWDQGNSMVVEGDAAFIHQGDWAAGQYNAADDFAYDSDWGNVAYPGTEGVYSLVMDSFVFPTNNPSPDATEKFLTYCGTTDAQERFNTKKGSIPPRTDVSMDAFGPFLQAQSEDFSNSDEQPPTIAHGTAVRPEIKSNIEGAFAAFLESYDVEGTYEDLVNAFDV